jgi:hypothetical protein
MKMPLLDSLAMEVELIQVTITATKHANKRFLSWLEGFFPYLSLGVEGWLWIGWVVCFGGFDGFLHFVLVGGRNKLGSTLLTLVLTSLKPNTQFLCGFGCTLFHMAQVILNHFLAHHSSLKTRSQIGNLLLQLSVFFGSMEKLTIARVNV